MNRTAVSSSNISSIGYDENNSTLEVEFKNRRIYHYFNVPSQEHANLMRASSHGKHLANHIIGNYRDEEQ
ncbi:MAG: hypothetical protein ACJA1C_002861 [Crocinitomicaceae bacterium]|jgi:hypothetical protein